MGTILGPVGKGLLPTGLPRLVSIFVVHNVKSVKSPGAVNRCLPLPMFEMLVERAPPHVRQHGHQHRLQGQEQPGDLEMLTILFLPVQVQQEKTTRQDYESVPRKYNCEDKFQ